MHIEPFRLERYFAKYEFNAPYLLSCSDCESLSIKELLDMQPGSDEEFMQLKLGYTESEGAPLLRYQIAGIYSHIAPQDILVHTGAEEAIFNLMNVTLNKGDHIIVHYPCYQSLMEVAIAIGAEVTLWKGDPANGWRLDLDELKDLVRPSTKLVVINCPHNPTGFLMPTNEFEELVNLSQKHGFIVFSDEVYRYLEYDEQDRLPAICEVDDRSIRFFEKHAQLFTWKQPKAGPIAFPLFNSGNIEEFCRNLVTRAGVMLVPGTIYDPSYSNFRIGFGRANLEECVQKFDEFLQT
jgi:aspartate/methionine/tyrosine aminotransferase